MSQASHMQVEALDGQDAAPGAARPTSDVVILGVPFARLAPTDVIARVQRLMQGERCHHVVLANAHTLNCAAKNPAYRQMLQRAALVLRDGVGVEIAARLAGQRLEHNYVGTDFVPMLLAALAAPRVRVFLYGGAPEVAGAAGRTLTRLVPPLEVVGFADGYGDPEAVIERVRSSRPDVLLVALGNPLQEQWIDSQLPRLNARVAIGVGALFDFLGGRVQRAPRWVRRMRLEWAYRLWREPGRLWRRYLIGNVTFMVRVAATARRNRACRSA